MPSTRSQSRFLRPTLAASFALVLTAGLAAQGFIAPEIAAGPGRIAGHLTIELESPSTPGGRVLIGYSDVQNPVPDPIYGLLPVDPTAAVFRVYPFPSQVDGSFNWTLPLPNDPMLATAPPRFVGAAVEHPVLPGGFTFTVGRRLQFDFADSWRSVGSLAAARAFHQATFLGTDRFDPEQRVLVTGGGPGSFLAPSALASTEFYNPLTRAMEAGPMMSQARVFHQAIRLLDGRLLVCGGADAAGLGSATAEVWDPASGNFAVVASMNVPRLGHAATLLDDGRVLVSGGLSTYAGASTNPLMVFNSAQSSAEIYDPVANSWTVIAAMGTARSGHTQTRLNDGRLLIVGGIERAMDVFGFGIPVATSTCEIFDPATSGFAPTAGIVPARAFHATTTLASGDVLMTGGASNTGPFSALAAESTSLRFDGAMWSVTAPLAQPTAFHVQAATANGGAFIAGGAAGDAFSGFTATSLAGTHDGTTYTPATAIGGSAAPTPASAAAMAVLGDGRFLVTGGNDGDTTPNAVVVTYLD